MTPTLWLTMGIVVCLLALAHAWHRVELVEAEARDYREAIRRLAFRLTQEQDSYAAQTEYAAWLEAELARVSARQRSGQAATADTASVQPLTGSAGHRALPGRLCD